MLSLTPAGDRKGSRAHPRETGWDGGMTPQLRLFPPTDLESRAGMSDANEDVRGVLQLPGNPLEMEKAPIKSQIQPSELRA